MLRIGVELNSKLFSKNSGYRENLDDSIHVKLKKHIKCSLLLGFSRPIGVQLVDVDIGGSSTDG